MNTASLELCKELYKLSRWVLTEKHWYKGEPAHLAPYGWDCPAYDLGYLLRKLPADIHMQQRSEHDRIIGWRAVWHSVPKGYEVYEGKSISEMKPDHLQASADTPEDAACKLAIELFKQGILKV